MLESKDCAILENLPPILGAIMDNCCVQSIEIKATTFFTQYVRRFIDLFRRNRRPNWTSSELTRFELSIRFFNKYTADLFGT